MRLPRIHMVLAVRNFLAHDVPWQRIASRYAHRSCIVGLNGVHLLMLQVAQLFDTVGPHVEQSCKTQVILLHIHSRPGRQSYANRAMHGDA